MCHSNPCISFLNAPLPSSKFQYLSKTGVKDFSEKYGVLLQGKTNLAGYDSL